jgi:hypothetical protein
VDPRSHRKKEKIDAYIVVELFAGRGGGPGRTWCSGVQSKNIQACIALQVKAAKESNIQRARARGLRKNSLGKRQRKQAKRAGVVGHFGRALGLGK